MKRVMATILAGSLSLPASAYASAMKEAWGEAGYTKSDITEFRVLKGGFDASLPTPGLKAGMFIEHFDGDILWAQSFSVSTSGGTATIPRQEIPSSGFLLGGALTFQSENGYFRSEVAIGQGEIEVSGTVGRASVSVGLDADLYGARIEVGKEFAQENFSLTPFVGVIHASVSFEGFDESDTGLFGGVKLERTTDKGSLYLKATGANNTYGFDDEFTYGVTAGIKFRF